MGISKIKGKNNGLVSICPRCGSHKISADSSSHKDWNYGETELRCSDCGLASVTFPEVDKSKAAAIQKEAKSESGNAAHVTDKNQITGFYAAMTAIEGSLLITGIIVIATGVAFYMNTGEILLSLMLLGAVFIVADFFLIEQLYAKKAGAQY